MIPRKVVISHWREHFPELVAELDAQGRLEETVAAVLKRRDEEIDSLMRAGLTYLQARDEADLVWLEPVALAAQDVDGAGE